MTKFIVVVAAASVTAGFMGLSAAVASAAPDIVGATYADAKQKITQAGQTPIIRTRVGDKVREDKCVVDSAENAPGNGKTVYVSLNCNGVAPASNSGSSQQSPTSGTASGAEQQAQAAQHEQTEQSITSSNHH